MEKRSNFILFIIIGLITIFLGILIPAAINDNVHTKNLIKKEMLSHYNETVRTTKNSKIYIKDNNGYKENGIIESNELLSLTIENIDYNEKKFHIKDLNGEFYINYDDVEPIKENKNINERYKNYIPFNENIITKNITKFYNDNNRLVYIINKSLSLPILIKYDDSYGVIYNNRLLKIRKDDIEKIVESKNTSLIPAKEIAVLNYHFFYDENKEEDVKECNQAICHPKSQVISHIDYIKENNILPLSMNEFEMWMNRKLNLPKSVLITIDDGWRMYIGIDLFEENRINANVFLITSWFKKDIKFLHDYEYIEFHSHGDNLHNRKECPGGQGGAIKCWPKDKLLEDLSLSRKKLEGSTVFCYPFYEYNDYSISVLKEAGFTMAFKGGQKRSSQNDDKFRIPRYELSRKTTIEKLKDYIG